MVAAELGFLLVLLHALLRGGYFLADEVRGHSSVVCSAACFAADLGSFPAEPVGCSVLDVDRGFLLVGADCLCFPGWVFVRADFCFAAPRLVVDCPDFYLDFFRPEACHLAVFLRAVYHLPDDCLAACGLVFLDRFFLDRVRHARVVYQIW